MTLKKFYSIMREDRWAYNSPVVIRSEWPECAELAQLVKGWLNHGRPMGPEVYQVEVRKL